MPACAKATERFLSKSTSLKNLLINTQPSCRVVCPRWLCVCGRTIDFTVPGQVVIPKRADLELYPAQRRLTKVKTGDWALATQPYSLFAYQARPSRQSRLSNACKVGLGRQPLVNSMKTQFARCSFSKIDFIPASGFDQFDNGATKLLSSRQRSSWRNG